MFEYKQAIKDIVNEIIQIVGTEVYELMMTHETFNECNSQKILKRPIFKFNLKNKDM